MGNTYPIQNRAIDPYAQYNSNVVNALSHMFTGGEDALLNINPPDIADDTTSPGTFVVLTPGILIKDDVMIEITDYFRIDMSDADFYDSTSAFNETGYYYISLRYNYVKTRPAPEGNIRIFKDSERGSFDSSTDVLIKVVHVSYSGGYTVDTYHDYDPDNVTISRVMTKVISEKVPFLDTFDPQRDRGRYVTVTSTGYSFTGGTFGWVPVGSLDIPYNTSLCGDAQLVYMDSSGVIRPAIATSITTKAIGVVSETDTYGMVRFSGNVWQGPLETGITVHHGDKLYLSATEAGKATNVAPSSPNIIQEIGVQLTDTTNYFETVLSPLINDGNDHERLYNLFGGASNNHYHLTSTDYNHVTNQDFTHNNLTSKQGGDGTNFYHLSSTLYNNLVGSSAHNNLSGIQGGDSSNRYHLTLTQYNNVDKGRTIISPYSPTDMTNMEWRGTAIEVPDYYATGTKLFGDVVYQLYNGGTSIFNSQIYKYYGAMTDRLPIGLYLSHYSTFTYTDLTLVLVNGIIRNDSWGLTVVTGSAFNIVYCSPTTPGALTLTRPISGIIFVVGHLIANNTLYVNPGMWWN